MLKQEFLDQLKARLSNLPKQELEEYLNFYDEMINDRIEDGLAEVNAVAQIGSVDVIATQIMSENQRNKMAKKSQPKRRLKAWEILLLILGSPIWLSLLIAAFSVVLALYVSLWSILVSLWAIFASLIFKLLKYFIIPPSWYVENRFLTVLSLFPKCSATLATLIFLSRFSSR